MAKTLGSPTWVTDTDNKTVDGMKKKWLVKGALILGFLPFFIALPSHAQKSPKTLTLVYSNNINGEIDPCPT